MFFSIILPTRTRIRQIKEFIESIDLTSSYFKQGELEVCFYVDWDDGPSWDAIEELKNKYGENKIKYISSETPLNLSQMWNYSYEKLATGEIIMHCGDDIRFRTNDWDIKIKEKFDNSNDKIILVYGDDGIRHNKLATHSFVHRKWIEVSGFWLPPYFVSDYNDTWLDFVARYIKRIVYIPEIYTEHLHYVVKKAEIDENTNRRLKRHDDEKTEIIYKNTENERIMHAKKLLDYINNYNQHHDK
jgi:hypothetical protein